MRPFDDPDLAAATALIRDVQHEQHVGYTETRYTDEGSAVDPAPARRRSATTGCACRASADVRADRHRAAAGQRLLLGERLPRARPRATATAPPGRRSRCRATATTSCRRRRQPTRRLVEHTRTLFFDDDPGDPAAFLDAAASARHARPARPDLRDIQARAHEAAARRRAGGRGSTRRCAGVLDTPTRRRLRAAHLAGRRRDLGRVVDPLRHRGLRGGRRGALLPARALHRSVRQRDDASVRRPRPLRRVVARRARQHDDASRASTTACSRPPSSRTPTPTCTEARSMSLGRVVAVALKGKGAEADDLTASTTTSPTRRGDGSTRSSPRRPTAPPRAASSATRPPASSTTSARAVGRRWDAAAGRRLRDRPRAARRPRSPPGEVSPLQVAFECSDGSGTVLMKRSQAEPEQAGGPLRWIVSGKTVAQQQGQAGQAVRAVLQRRRPSAAPRATSTRRSASRRSCTTTPPGGWCAPSCPTAPSAASSSRRGTSRASTPTTPCSKSSWYADRGSPDPTAPLPPAPHRRRAPRGSRRSTPTRRR